MHKIKYTYSILSYPIYSLLFPMFGKIPQYTLNVQILFLFFEHKYENVEITNISQKSYTTIEEGETLSRVKEHYGSFDCKSLTLVKIKIYRQTSTCTYFRHTLPVDIIEFLLCVLCLF